MIKKKAQKIQKNKKYRTIKYQCRTVQKRMKIQTFIIEHTEKNIKRRKNEDQCRTVQKSKKIQKITENTEN